MHILLRSEIIHGVKDFSEIQFAALQPTKSELSKLINTALRSKNFHFINAILKWAIEVNDKEILGNLYKQLAQGLDIEENKAAVQLALLRIHNALLSSCRAENELIEAVKIIGSIDFPQVFKEACKKFSTMSILDPLTGRDILLSSVLVHVSLVYPLIGKVPYTVVVAPKELAQYALQLVANPKFALICVRLMKYLETHAVEFSEELMVGLKRFKIRTGGLPSGLLENLHKEIENEELQHIQRTFVAYLFYEGREYDRVAELCRKSQRPSAVEKYMLSVAESSEAASQNVFAEARTLCSKGEEKKACELLKERFYTQRHREDDNLEKMRRIYDRLFSTRHSKEIQKPQESQKSSILSELTSESPYSILKSFMVNEEQLSKLKGKSSLLHSFFQDTMKILYENCEVIDEEEAIEEMFIQSEDTETVEHMVKDIDRFFEMMEFNQVRKDYRRYVDYERVVIPRRGLTLESRSELAKRRRKVINTYKKSLGDSIMTKHVRRCKFRK